MGDEQDKVAQLTRRQDSTGLVLRKEVVWEAIENLDQVSAQVSFLLFSWSDVQRPDKRELVLRQHDYVAHGSHELVE